jgi:hypothetical protein
LGLDFVRLVLPAQRQRRAVIAAAPRLEKIAPQIEIAGQIEITVQSWE